MLWNTTGAFLWPNGITVYAKVPLLVTNAKNFYESTSTGIYQNPLAKSNFVENNALPRQYTISSISGNGYLIDSHN